jgi:hypothetical protein
MKHKIIVSFSSFILLTVLFILISSICHVNPYVSCYFINLMVMIIWLGSLLISIVVLID